MNKPLRTVAVLCGVLFAALLLNVTYLQYVATGKYDNDARNRRVVDEQYSRDRGAILVGRTPIAESVPSHDQYKYKRVYGQPQLYAPVTGYFGYGGAVTGLEKSQNSILSGSDSRLFVNRLVDLIGNQGPEGGDVETTINAKAQQAAYSGLSKLPASAGAPVEGAVVALEPSTGKILALATYPSFDPNKIAAHNFGAAQKSYDALAADKSQPLLDRAVQLALPPGSTFKTVTATAAINNGIYTADSTVPGGDSFQLPLTHGPTGLVTNEGRSCGVKTTTFAQGMENSCNTVFAPMAIKVGAGKMLETAQGFGFNSDYFDQLQGTNGTSLTATSVYPKDPNPAQLGQTGFGQFDVRATPLQMAMVAAGIANKGVVMKPYLIDQIQSANSDVVATTQPEQLSTAASPQAAAGVTQLMVDTVNHGTASPGAIAGIQVAGKTGTAQAGDPSIPPYAWYISFAPADNPKVAVAVLIQQANIPRNDIGGGLWGGPIARDVMKAVLQ